MSLSLFKHKPSPPPAAPDSDSDSEAGEVCWWCGGGVLLPRRTNKTDQACDACKKVNILKLLMHRSDKYSPDKTTKIELDWVDKLASHPNCTLCRVVVHCLRETYHQQLPDTFWKDGKIKGQRVKCFIEGILPSDHNFQGTTALGCLLVVTEPPLETLLNPSEELPDTTQVKWPRAVLLSEGCMERRHIYGGVKRRRLWPDVDLDLLKAWISACERGHRHKPPQKQLPAFVRVIDVQNGCLVRAPPQCRYVTLSYVWGGPQKFALRAATKDELHRPGSLSSNRDDLPWTIRDFLNVVSGLGERYAWVDSLCIIQDDQADVRENVQAMGLIYESAVLTVVAASGTNANSGLAGIRLGTRRAVQGREIIERMAMGVPLPPLDEVIQASTWNSRVWTYQESVLSQRTLYFTDSQVHYKCARGCTACEETWEDAYEASKSSDKGIDAKLHSYEPRMLARTTAQDVHEGGRTNFGWWWHHVEAISSRKTTEAKDRFHALEGILYRLQSLFDDHGFAWGLPTSALDVALLWRPSGACVRNAAIDNSGVQLPSWSWVGWTGKIRYRIWNICECSHSLVSWIDMTKAGPVEERRFDSRTCRAPSQQWLDENGWKRFKSDDTPSFGFYYMRDKPDSIRYVHPMAFEKDQGPERAVDKATGELNFFAESARFSIPRDHIQKIAQTDLELDMDFSGRHLCLFDDDGHVAGVVLADPETLLSLNQDKFECIAIVNTTLTRVEWDQCFIDKEERFRHLVECPIIKEDPSRPPSQPFVWPTMDKNAHWDFYESCWHEKEVVTCPYYDLSDTEERYWVSPFRSIHPTAGPFPFDPRYYSTLRPWPLNEVLLVQRQGDIVYRIGIGYVHCDAWEPLAEEKHIRLR
ncbi:hypothetical protein NM208_g8130 [Fusarium decemcellulare]|uniref:Uncharacterized protein n=1 Tax=Fusarium decemcellulare TaxID=57161 RepID=A0ACC1S6F5_9HYPO|nr:hypothetical protein NM208_g8130 [Fusarium decemcellulare]